MRAGDNGDVTVDLLMPKPRDRTVATIDAAGVSWYRRVSIASDCAVSIPVLWNSVSPAHELVCSLARQTPEGLAVSFTLSAAGWGGRDDRRPGWIQLLGDQDRDPLWPDVAHPDAKDWRLNLSPMRASIFGRLSWEYPL